MKKRIIAVLVGAFLAFNTFGGLMVTAAGEGAEDENKEQIEEVVEDPVENVKQAEEQPVEQPAEQPTEQPAEQPVEQNNSIADLVTVTVTRNDGSAISSGTISKNNVNDITYKVKYSFSPFNLNMTDDDFPNLELNKEYSLPDIENISEFDFTETITMPIKNEQEELGVIVVTPNGDKATVTVRFTADEGGKIEKANAELILTLNTTTTVAERTVKFPDGSTYKFTIDELVAKAPTMEFKGEIASEDNTALWTAIIKNDANNPKAYANGYTFEVALDSGETYVDGSFTVDGEPVEAVVTDGKLVYTLTSVKAGASETTTIAYKTKKGDFKLTPDVVKQNQRNMSDTLNDKPVLKDASNEDTIATGDESVTFNKTLVSWLEKEPGAVSADGTIQWTVTVRNNGYALKNVTLYDLFGGDGANMALVDGTLKVNDNLVDPSAIIRGDGNEYSYSIVLGDMSSDVTEFVVKYSTQITSYDKYLKENHASHPSNKAWVEYEYDGFGDGIFKGPNVTKEAQVKHLKAGIEIRPNTENGSAFDAATHRLKWKVFVNQEYQPLKNVKVTDLIPAGQKYVADSISLITYKTATGSIRTAAVKPGSNMVIDLGDLDSEKAEFTIETELTDDAVATWSDNKTGTFENKVQLDYEGLENSQLDKTSITYSSQVLSTNISNYSYKDHTVDVTVVVDANKMDMSNAVLTDALVNGPVEYTVASDVLVNGEKATYTVEDGNLVVALGSISRDETNPTKTVTFTAKVSSENYEKINGGSFNLGNKATLVTDDIKKLSAKNVSVNAAPITVQNSILVKNGAANKEIGEAGYTVYINKARNQLPKGTVVTDTLGSSLELDGASVVLYRCELNADGSVAAEAAVDAEKAINRLDNGKTELTVKLPAGDDVYKLTYTAMLSDIYLKDTTNSISMAMTETAVLTSSVNAYFSFTAGAEFTKAAYIDITAKDKEGNVLPNVPYVITDADGNEIMQVTTNAEGKISVRTGKLKADQEYFITPVKTPKGYKDADVISTGEIKLGKKNGQNIDFVYDKKTVNIPVSTHIDAEDGELLDGATVKVTKDGTDYTSWKTSENTLTNLEWGHTYVITNPSAPNEYKTDKNTITLKVQLNEAGAVVVVRDGQLVEDAKIVVATKNTANLTIDNVSSSQKNPVLGNTIVISTTETPTEETTISTMVTDGTTKEVNLPEGDYYIIQTDTPVGFEKAPTKKITVNADGTIEENGEALADNALVIENDHNSEKYTATFSPEVMGINPSMFKAMKFTLYKKNNDKLEKVEPKNDNTDEELVYDLDYQDEYVFVPEETLSGYKPVEPMTIRAIGTTLEDSKLQVKPKDSEVYDDITVEEIGEQVKPQPVPVVINNNDNSEHHHYYGPAKPAANDELKDKEITALANTDAAASGRLAKTGGFLGTLTGYLAAALLMLFGAYLVFGNRKRVK
ncbi:MAG: hypothetical protein IKP29_06760 [Pseudobutyrivibrio sp.]|nr:hypothetical protein [Pseudobutyrivibrio sp.]